MILHLLLAVSAYVLGAAAVHAALRLTERSRMSASGTHLVLHTHNDSHHLEWALRSLTLYSWLRGQPLTITIRDTDSTDDTRQMLRLFARRDHRLHIQTSPPLFTSQNKTPEHASAILSISSDSTSRTGPTNPPSSINPTNLTSSTYPTKFSGRESGHSASPVHIHLGSPEDWGKLPYLI